jgi:predicted Zn-dependent protease with MMP-like domain
VVLPVPSIPMDDRHARHRRRPADRTRRPNVGFPTRDRARFARLVADSLATLPSGLRRHLDGVEIRTDDLPASDWGTGEAPLTRWETRQRPDGRTTERLTIHRRPVELRALDRDDLRDLVRTAVVNRIAERHGLDQRDLDDLGW